MRGTISAKSLCPSVFGGYTQDPPPGACRSLHTFHIEYYTPSDSLYISYILYSIFCVHQQLSFLNNIRMIALGFIYCGEGKIQLCIYSRGVIKWNIFLKEMSKKKNDGNSVLNNPPKIGTSSTPLALRLLLQDFILFYFIFFLLFFFLNLKIEFPAPVGSGL